MTLTKGALTRLQIIDKAREIFNEYGIDITLEQLTKNMGLSKARVNNHFRTKDSLFLAILDAYEIEFGHLQSMEQPLTKDPFQAHVDTHSKIMDLQFKYRCGTQYLNLVTNAENALTQHVREKVTIHSQSILLKIKFMVEKGWVREEILLEPNWSSFLFVYINGFTQWSIFYNMYDRPKEYKNVKSKYLRGIFFHGYGPFLTKKGKKIFDELDFEINK